MSQPMLTQNCSKTRNCLQKNPLLATFLCKFAQQSPKNAPQRAKTRNCRQKQLPRNEAQRMRTRTPARRKTAKKRATVSDKPFAGNVSVQIRATVANICSATSKHAKLSPTNARLSIKTVSKNAKTRNCRQKQIPRRIKRETVVKT